MIVVIGSKEEGRTSKAAKAKVASDTDVAVGLPCRKRFADAMQMTSKGGNDSIGWNKS